MLRIRVRLESSGLLAEVDAEGHAGFARRGRDIVCAAATLLLRTVARTFEGDSGYIVEGSAESRGRLHFSVRPATGTDTDWGKGVTEMFVKGIDDLSREFPKHIELTISND